MTGRDWPNLWRMAAALLALILSPLLGIVVGTVFWQELERGMLIFSLLGMACFSIVVRPYWRGSRARMIPLVTAACGLAVSCGSSILFDSVPAAYALSFALACESFSLIPWVTDRLQEIHQGQWRKGGALASGMGRSIRKKTGRRVVRAETPRYAGPEVPLRPTARRVILLCLILAAGILAAVWALLRSEAGGRLGEHLTTWAMEVQFPAPRQVEQVLETRYGESFTVLELCWENTDMRTWSVHPADDPGLVFTVATGPASVEEKHGLGRAVGEDNYLQHAWNQRVVPLLLQWGMDALPIDIPPDREAVGSSGELVLPEAFHDDKDTSALVGWYILPAAYWAGEKEDWPRSARQVAALMRELRGIAPFCHTGSIFENADMSLGSYSWRDWVMPVAVSGGFVGLPIQAGYSDREVLDILEQAQPYRYYIVEEGCFVRPSNFAPAPPVPLPTYPG